MDEHTGMIPALSTRSFTIRTAATLVPAWAIPSWITLGVALTAASQWRFRFWWHADGVSYLEVARQYGEGNFSRAVVGNWSPLYSWILIPVTRLRPDFQLPVAHAIQAILMVLTLLAGWSLAVRLERAAGHNGPSPTPASALTLGATLLSTLTITTPRYLSPDVLGLLIALLIVTRTSREFLEAPSAWHQLITGGVIGLGYLARQWVLPWTLAIGVGSLLLAESQQSRRRAFRRLPVYALGFIVIAGPWIAVLSHHFGRMTLGTAGRTNIVGRLPIEYVGVPDWPRLLAGGHVRDYRLGFAVSMPEHYDPQLLGEYHIHHVLPGLVRLVAANICALAFGYYDPDLPLYWPVGILIVLAILAFLGFETPRTDSDRLSVLLLIIAAAGFAMFIVSHVESRYLAAFIVVFAGALTIQVVKRADRTLSTAALTVALLFCGYPVMEYVNGFRTSQQVRRIDDTLARWLGAHGDKYAVVGPTYEAGMAAYLSRTQLVAGVDFGRVSPVECEAIRNALRALDVSAVLASTPNIYCGRWESVAHTSWLYWGVGNESEDTSVRRSVAR